jgi:hypothetical protein
MRKAALCGIALASLALGVAPAAAASTSDAVVHDLATTDAQQQAVKDYWTPQRIAAMPTGPSSPGTPPVDGPDGSSWAQGTVTDKSVGRLFFVDRDGEDGSCTATIVPSAARSVAVTGAHCVHQANLIGEDPKWATNMLFVSGFRDNAKPFGAFPVRTAVVHKTWIDDDQQSGYDQAFLVLSGKVGGVPQGIAFDQPAGAPVQEFGYPRAARLEGHQGRPEFTGMRIARCYGTAVENPGTPEWPEEGLWGVPCDMGGGASGGPRIGHFVSPAGVGVVVGVNTQSAYIDTTTGKGCPSGDETCTRHLVGPQFSKAITQPLYLRALQG